MGAQPLYRLDLDAWEGGRRSDAASVSFGIRRVAVRLTERGHALFEVNGRPLLVRGAGWASDVLLRHDPLRDAAQLDYVLDLGLNTVRFEGMIERDDFLARCDREGLLVIAGWCCCDHWEKWDAWKPEDYEVANESLRSQIRRLRNHASLIAFWYGSDFPPPPRVEEAYLDVLREERWPNAVSSSAADKPTPVTGPSGMKMAGPYDWVPPSYWLEDRERGGAFGFATEVSPGPAPPPLESLRRMLGPEHLWPPDDDWKLHAGLQEFHSLEIFTSALAARYGAPRDAADFAKKAQLACYEAERAMFEGYARNKYVATGVIQWMLCNGWPSLIWHLFDWYLRPGGGYYGAKKALGELHVQYSYDDRSVVVVNDGWRDHPGLELSAELRNLDLERRFAARAALDVGADGVVRALTLPEPAGLSPTHFLDLRLSDAAGSCVARNFYWLSTQPDVLDRETAIWFTTACSRHADFSALGDLAPATLRASFSVAAPQRAGEPREAVASERLGARQDASITLENAGASLAFFVELRVTRGAGGDDVLPILWDDNYVTLLPGERRTLRASWPLSALAGARPALALSGWNLAPQILAPNGAVVAAGAGS
jgi:exo-1,4-beta-D-glucosaminidase